MNYNPSYQKKLTWNKSEALFLTLVGLFLAHLDTELPMNLLLESIRLPPETISGEAGIELSGFILPEHESGRFVDRSEVTQQVHVWSVLGYYFIVEMFWEM